jgi:DNA-binding GntR family transcriptional regulator
VPKAVRDDEPEVRLRRRAGSEPLAQQARDWIRSELAWGSWPPSDLLTEDELARRLAISRTPVREALHELALTGAIEPVLGGGYRRPRETPRMLDEHIALRRLLEPPAAEIVATARRHIDFDAKALDPRTLDPAENARFHIAIGEATGNHVLAALIRTLNERSEVHAPYLQGDAVREALASDHADIADALRRGDPERSFRATADHLDRVEALLRQRARTKPEAAAGPTDRRPAVRPAVRTSLADQAYLELRSAIATGRLRAGTPIIESAVASMLGASRTPVRQALRRCEIEGYLRRGADGTLLVNRPTASEMSQLLLVRNLLETYALRCAATRISDAELDQLDALVAEDRRALRRKQSDRLAQINEQIHALLIHASRNRTLERLIRSVQARITPYAVFALGSPTQQEQFVEEHARIAALLRDGEVDTAESTLRDHFSRVEALLVQGLE